MSFQFQCPQGHLLEGDVSQAGQQCNCPMCGMLFIIPEPIIESEPAVEAAVVAEQTPAEQPQPEPEEPKLLHIACPNGHVLEVPPDMLEQDCLCPHCQTQFTLRAKDSVEHRRKREIEAEFREQKAGQLWLNWAIGIAIVVVLGLAIMMIASR